MTKHILEVRNVVREYRLPRASLCRNRRACACFTVSALILKQGKASASLAKVVPVNPH